MQTNTLPRHDMTDNPTGCCPRFDPEGWDDQDIHFRDKRFVRATTRAIAHVPVNMGSVFTRVMEHIDKADAFDTGNFIVLSRDLSAFTGEHLFAVTKDVPGEEVVSLTGDFVTRVFEGPYSQARYWYDELAQLAESRGRTPRAIWFYYTTCPKCAKAYGKNYVVGLVQV